MIPHGVEVFVVLDTIDLRWSFHRLSALVSGRLEREAHLREPAAPVARATHRDQVVGLRVEQLQLRALERVAARREDTRDVPLLRLGRLLGERRRFLFLSFDPADAREIVRCVGVKIARGPVFLLRSGEARGGESASRLRVVLRERRADAVGLCLLEHRGLVPCGRARRSCRRPCRPRQASAHRR